MDCERGVKKNIFASGWIRNAVTAALMEEHIQRHVEINMLLTDDEGIRIINREYREIDEPTDVLSFPANDLKNPLFEMLAEGFVPEKDPHTGRLILGDIAISAERANAQAKEYGHSIKREISFLTTHAMLHLMGYDHIEKNDENIMRTKQRIIMERLKIKR
jgi:probable rRNA maturation factor